MLSLQFSNRYQLMAADEPFDEKPKNIFKYSKTASNMRSVAAADMISIDKMLNYEMADAVKEEMPESAEEDEISVGCPTPLGQSVKEEELDREDLQRPVRSPSCSSSSSSCPPSCGYDCKTPDDQADKHYSSSDDEHPIKGEPEEYFKPLKRLKMMKIDKTSFSISERSKSNLNKRLYRHHHHHNNNHKVSPVDEDSCQTVAGVKSFSICDILSHKPSKTAPTPVATLPQTSSKIVRPWDCEPHEETANPYLIPPPAHRGILPQPPLFLSQFHQQQMALHLQRVKSEDLSSAYESCSSSGRSSTGGSDCCTSPDVLNCSVQSTPASVSQHSSQRNRNEQQQRSKSSNGKSNSSPLDALFQLTSKTFDELNGDPNAENGSHLNLFNNRQQPKKKRKSRTAFTNNQIFELERRFIYQKYLSPADRDEIAAQLGLSNAQVITWFQNRRAKLKRDMEELKKDVESSKIPPHHNAFLENVQNLGILKKKPMSHSDCKNDSDK